MKLRQLMIKDKWYNVKEQVFKLVYELRVILVLKEKYLYTKNSRNIVIVFDEHNHVALFL